MSAEQARTSALFTHQGYRYTVVMIANGVNGVETELRCLPPRDDTKTPASKYFGRRAARTPAEARDHVERDFKAWVEGKPEGLGR